MSFTSSYYRGHDLLTEMPNEREDRNQVSRVRSDTLDNALGQVAHTRAWASPVLDQPFLWFLDSRARVTDFLLWCAVRRGQYAPLWVPTWRRNLTLAAPAASDAAELTVRSCGYTALHFPSEARRHLAALVPGGGVVTVIPRRVTDAADAGDGTETLTLESPFGVALPTHARVSFLVLCRLADDEVTLEWPHTHAAEAATRFVELPRQVEG